MNGCRVNPTVTMVCRAAFIAGLWCFTSESVCSAGDWPRFRGPTGTGVSAEKGLPLNWDGKTGEHVRWKAPLTGTTGHSSPIVWGDRVFLTTADKQTREQEKAKEIPAHHLVCYQASDGKLLWRTPIKPGKQVAGYAIYASPTPVTDGKVVYVWFGSGVVTAVDFTGKLLWRHEKSGPFNLNPGICSSPILYRDTVLLICDQNRGLGFLEALDKKSGKVRWKQERKKVGAYNATPLLIDVVDKTQLIVSATRELQGLDPASGAPIWWCKSQAFGASPVYTDGLIYADKGLNEGAVCVEPTGKGDGTETHVKWRLEKSPGDYSSPLAVGGYVYRVKSDGVMMCLELASGKQAYSARLEGISKLASPFATADGRIYFVSTGNSYVIEAGPKLKILGSGKLGGPRNGSSPAISNGRIFVRDFEFLYCLGDK